MLNLIIQQLYRRKWMERNFHCFCIFFVLERLLNARLDRLIRQNKPQSCSVQLQVSDKADRQTASSALCTRIYMLYLCVRGLASSLLVGAGVTQGLHWLTH